MKLYKIFFFGSLVILGFPAMAQISEPDPELVRARKIFQKMGKTEDISDAGRLAHQWVESLRKEFGEQAPMLPNVLSILGRFFYEKGAYSEAKLWFEKQVEISRVIYGPAHYETMRATGWLARMLGKMGDFSNARRLQEEMIEVFTRHLGEEHLGTLTAIANLAGTLKAQGDLGGARQRYEHIVEALTRLFGEKHPSTLTAIADLAGTLKAQGDLSGARQREEQVVETRTRHLGKEHPATLTAIANLAGTLKAQGDLCGARQRYEQVVEALARHLGKKHPDTLIAIANLAGTLFAQGDLDGARQRYEEVVEARERLLGNTHPATLSAVRDLAWTLKEMGDISDAQQLLEKVIKTISIINNSPPKTYEMADTLYGLGVIYRETGRHQQALKVFLDALDALEGHAERYDSAEATKCQFRTEKQGFYQLPFDLSLTLGRHREAFHILERYRAQSLLTLISRGSVKKTSPEHQQLRWKYDALTAQLEGPTSVIDPQIRTKLLKDQEQTWRDLQELHTTSATISLAPQKADEIRPHLDPGTVLLSYHVNSTGTYLFVLNRENPLKVFRLPVTGTALRAQARTFFPLLHTVDKSRSSLEDTVIGQATTAEAHLKAARWLYDHLLAPALGHIQDADRLLILPDGPLHYFPFAALVRPKTVATPDDPRDWQYLIEWKPIHTVQSAAVYAELQKRRPEAQPGATKTTGALVAFGDPNYPPLKPVQATPQLSESHDEPTFQTPAIARSAQERGLFDGLTPLPQTQHEVEKISQLFKEKGQPAEIYLGQQATEEEAKAAAQKARYLHFAAHGLADSDQPHHSFLALTIPKGLPPERENGILQAWEIIDHVRLNADLVVLSACVTAFGPNQGGEGLISLSRAFQIAGARTVAATLWPVADQSTAELMIRFYRHLLAGESKDQALRLAQIEFIREGIKVTNEDGESVMKDYSSPYHWAAFQLIGDWK